MNFCNDIRPKKKTKLNKFKIQKCESKVKSKICNLHFCLKINK